MSKQPPNSSPEPLVSVVIPAYNEQEVIDQCLQSLVQQDYGNFIVEMIDDESTDSTKKIIQSYVDRYPERVVLHSYGKVGPGKARNLTCKNSKADVFAFTDADCFAESNWLSEIVKAISLENVGSTGGPHLAPQESTAFQRSLEGFFKLSSPGMDFYKGPEGEIRETPHNPLCNVAYQASLFRELNGFKEDLFPGEDVEMDLRVRQKGYRITFNPKAIVYHHRPKDIRQWNKVMHAYGRAQGKMVRERGLERKIQAIGVFILCLIPAAGAGLFLFARFWGLALFALALLAFFKWRPAWNNKLGIYIHSFQWFNGFLEGFITKRSDPPGMKK